MVIEQLTRSCVNCGVVFFFVSELGGIPILVRLLDHELEEVHRAAAASLRNLSYSKSRDENKVNSNVRIFMNKSAMLTFRVMFPDVSGLNPEYVLHESVKVVHSFRCLFQLAIAECYGIEALIRLLKRTRRDEVRKHAAI